MTSSLEESKTQFEQLMSLTIGDQASQSDKKDSQENQLTLQKLRMNQLNPDGKDDKPVDRELFMEFIQRLEE